MLIGFTIVAAPLLFAIVNAAVQINHLSTRSEQLVMHGIRGTRNNQRMFEEIGALERTARLYQIIGSADLLDVYARNQERLVATLNELLAMPLDAGSHEDALALRARMLEGGQPLLWEPCAAGHRQHGIHTTPPLVQVAAHLPEAPHFG